MRRTVRPVPNPALPAGAAGADVDRRRVLGAFYTPAHAVGYMTSLLRDLGPDSRILEPSGGDGAFACGLLEHTDLNPDQVDVWDLDPAVASTLTALGVRFTCRDALLGGPSDPGPHTDRPYTHTIGNPPYLNKQSAYLKEHRDQLRARYAHIGVNDTYALFTAMALDQLTDGGQLIFLISDTFLTLGIHRKLRHLLLTQSRIDEITLLPAGTFPDAAVRTAILALTRTPAAADHQVRFRDLRDAPVGDYTGGTDHRVPQAELLGNPGHVFAFTREHRDILRVLDRCPTKLVDLLDGGLGLYTRDNGRYLRVIDHPGTGPLVPVPRGQDPLPAAHVGTGPDAPWRHYHKRGGEVRWWRPAEHALAWTETARRQYGIPASVLVGEPPTPQRTGLVVSGVAARLSARTMTPGALWESNKAFGFFPKDPARHPVELLVAVLNSAWYAQAARSLNHTVSLQVRDLAALPWLPFTPAEEAELADLGRAAVSHVRSGAGDPPQQQAIDRIVKAAADRALA